MTIRSIVLICGMAFSGCTAVNSSRTQPEFQDMSISLPVFDQTLQPDADLDGYTLQAIRIAADDLLSADPIGLPCGEKQVSYRYRAVRRGDIVFVRIDFKPECCGRKVGMLDDGATYAVGVDGRILRRTLDGG